MRTTLVHLLETNPVIVADGGMGTLLFARGLQRGNAPELMNVEHPEVVRGIHAEYIAAGEQIILTNTFGGTRARLQAHGIGARAAELNRAGAALARAEADRADHPVVVGGSMGPTGQMLEPYGELSHEAAVELFAEQAQALIDGGVDVLWIETMSALEEVQAALEGCASLGLPCVATMTFDTHGRTMMGVTPAKAVRLLHGVIALGANCGNGPDELEAVIQAMRAADDDTILVAKANAGLPHMQGATAVYDATPQVMAEYALRVRANGARIIGSCCGSTPDHIRAIAAALHGEPAPR